MADDSANSIPRTMRAWVIGKGSGGIEKRLKLETNYTMPASFRQLPGQNAVLVRVLVASVNPVDYKLVEMPLVGRFLLRQPTTPGNDFCGRVVASTAPGIVAGQLVAGKTVTHVNHGSLAEYVVASGDSLVVVPEGVTPEQAATLGVCGLTAWQSLVPHIRRLTAAASQHQQQQLPLRVFINGGSGGVGTFGIQIAKAMGCHVTVSCSTANVELCRRLGADDIIDYRTRSVTDALAERAASSGRPYDIAVDNVGVPFSFYKAADNFLATWGVFVVVGVGSISDILWINLLPSFFGGGYRSCQFIFTKNAPGDLRQILDLMAAGKIKVPIEDAIPFEEVPRAFEKLKTNHVRGKIIVKVADNA